MTKQIFLLFAYTVCALFVPTGIASANEWYPLQVCNYPANSTQEHSCSLSVTVNRGSKYLSVPGTCRNTDGTTFIPKIMQCDSNNPRVDDNYPCTHNVYAQNDNAVCYMHWGDNKPNSAITSPVTIHMVCQPGGVFTPYGGGSSCALPD